METKKCLYCDKEFEDRTDNKNKLYCSSSCCRKYNRKLNTPIINMECITCSKLFKTTNSRRKFCSNECRIKESALKTRNKKQESLKVKERHCKFCNQVFSININNQKKEYCSKLCGARYLKKLYPKIKNKEQRFDVYKNGAKNRNIDFNLSFEQFKSFWNKPCYYCEDEINGVGIDRVNNNIGYEIDNCVSCCSECNKMKRAMTQENFYNKCKKIFQVRYHNTNTQTYIT